MKKVIGVIVSVVLIDIIGSAVTLLAEQPDTTLIKAVVTICLGFVGFTFLSWLNQWCLGKINGSNDYSGIYNTLKIAGIIVIALELINLIFFFAISNNNISIIHIIVDIVYGIAYWFTFRINSITGPTA